ncbi:hypothetical protein Y032_0317g2333 [Ancylostoma ceylanicum]|uniref:Reverse transcriptase domain-containing protein n=1 Tax=Ancylostoma ceylanicum TaxID=53326 RepID=A0A016S1N4_9BILA|nr:hypothetical protein Y032_0317g2333 [Ancylostoma ceylanicum]
MKRGVEQGDICSPKAFTCALKSVVRQVAEKDGFEIHGETLQMLLFADDVVLVASKPATLQSLLNEMCHLTESIGLKIHPGKTKWMKNAYCDDFEIKLNNQLVERVEHYVYLGQAIRMDNDLQLELSRQRKAGWIAFSKIDVLLRNKDIPAQTKSQLSHSNVLPALLYGCETWNLTKAEERSLQVAQRAMERRMLGISRLEHKKNEEIREISQLHEIVNLLHKRKKIVGRARRQNERQSLDGVTFALVPTNKTSRYEDHRCDG